MSKFCGYENEETFSCAESICTDAKNFDFWEHKLDKIINAGNTEKESIRLLADELEKANKIQMDSVISSLDFKRKQAYKSESYAFFDFMRENLINAFEAIEHLEVAQAIYDQYSEDKKSWKQLQDQNK